MDGALSNSRGATTSNYHKKNNNNNNNYHNHRRGRDGGGYRHHPYHRGGGYHGGGRGRGGGRHHNHNNNHHGGGGGGGGRPRQANRFESSGTKSVDPQSAMLKQLSAIVAKMGDLNSSVESYYKNQEEEQQQDGSITIGSTSAGSTVESSGGGGSTVLLSNGEKVVLKGVVSVISKNIQDFVTLLCSVQNAPLFLTYQPYTPPSSTIKEEENEDSMQDTNGITNNNNTTNGNNNNNTSTERNAKEEAGILATLVNSCAITLPLPSPSYAGLTLGVEEYAPTLSNIPSITDGTPANPGAVANGGVDYKGFAKRCVTLTCRRFGSDLDALCGVTYLDSSSSSSLNTGIAIATTTTATATTSTNSNTSADVISAAFVRTKLALRYMALLARTNIIQRFEEGDDEDGTTPIDIEHLNQSCLSMTGLLALLMEAATQAMDQATTTTTTTTTTTSTTTTQDSDETATQQTFQNTALLLGALVLSTIPYMVEYTPQDLIDTLLEKMEIILKEYKSPYQPGRGTLAFLLKGEQEEEAIGEDGIESDDDDDDEEEDDDDDEDAPVCADTLQDLYRTISQLVQKYYQSKSESTTPTSPQTYAQCLPTRYAQLSDAPWSGLKANVEEYAPMEGDDEDELLKHTREAKKELMYSGDTLILNVEESCRLIPFLLGGQNSGSGLLQGSLDSSAVVLQCYSLEGVVFGRLAMFDAPSEDDDEEEEDDDDEEENQNSMNKNPNLDAYTKTFSLVDRFFLFESVRDCLLCYQSNVSDTGIERGSCKDVAEQIWAVSHLFSPPTATTTADETDGDGDDTTGAMDTEDGTTSNGDISVTNPSKGIEYGIVEAILSLIIQAPRGVVSTSPLSHVYLSRVLLELTKSQPSLVPQSLVVALSVVFEDVVPTLSPIGKDNLSCWLAYHLTNTEYQWPKAFWTLWTPFVTKGMALDNDDGNAGGSQVVQRRKRNSRGEFVTQMLQYMATNLSMPDMIVRSCLPQDSPLFEFLFKSISYIETSHPNSAFQSALDTLQDELTQRISRNGDTEDAIREYLLSDETSESVQGTLDDSMGTSSSNDDDLDKIWWRTGVAVRSLLHSAKEDHSKMEMSIENSRIMTDGNENGVDQLEDVVTETEDIISRCKSIILGSLAKDIQVHEENLDLRGESKSSEADTLLMGECYVLKQCERIASYSSVVFTSCIETCFKHKVVSAIAIIRWALNDEGNQADTTSVVSKWWELASLAMRLHINLTISDDESKIETSGDLGMIIDTGGDYDEQNAQGTPLVRRMKKITDSVEPLLDYTVKRVTYLLENAPRDSSSKKMTHFEVDLVEGTKYFLRVTSSFLKHSLKQDQIVKSTTEHGVSSAEVENWLCKCNFGKKAAQIWQS